MSGASSLRNAVKRITHKERAQPSDRQRFGLLEKHKDYVVRAKDHKNKAGHIKNLKKKAAERNPDEFYFGMHKSQVRSGIHESTVNNSLDMDTVKLLKTQDAGYIAYRKSLDDKKTEKLRESFHFIGQKRPRSHKIFVDNEEEVQNFDVAEHFDTAPELVDRAFNRPRKETLEKLAESNISLKDAGRGSQQAYKELKQREKRSDKLGKALHELHLQRALMGKGSKKKLTVKGEDGKEQTVFKWKRQRCK